MAVSDFLLFYNISWKAVPVVAGNCLRLCALLLTHFVFVKMRQVKNAQKCMVRKLHLF
jgi:hypothetical protein